jgi:N-acetylmuramoyl-L-alanine amidase
VPTYYTVEQGDCLSSLAETFGLADWQTIYNDPNNAELRNLRPNPNVLLPGDTIYIPDNDSKKLDGSTDQKHHFVVKVPQTWLRILIRDGQQVPAAGCKYHLEIDGIPCPDRTLGSDGMLAVKIPATAESGTLTVWFDSEVPEGTTWVLRLGHLDPVGEETGIQARLNNLGYPCGAVDGIIGPLTRAAVRSFQEDNNLAVDGIAGPITQAKLKKVHGC